MIDHDLDVELQKGTELCNILLQIQMSAKFGNFELNSCKVKDDMVVKYLTNLGYDCCKVLTKDDCEIINILWSNPSVVETNIYDSFKAYRDANNRLGVILFYIKNKALNGSTDFSYKYQLNVCEGDVQESTKALIDLGFTIKELPTGPIISWYEKPKIISFDRDFDANIAREMAINAQYEICKSYIKFKKEEKGNAAIIYYASFKQIYSEVFDLLELDGYIIQPYDKGKKVCW